MISNQKYWQYLFLFCLGLALGSAFCMKWMESDFILGTEKFSLIGLELFYPLEKVETVLAGLDKRVTTILGYHLYFDFVFMAGIFPLIATLCMMARERTGRSGWKKLLIVLAMLQLLAWVLDITENTFLLGWLKNPKINVTDFMLFHLAVATKWILALLGIFTPIPFLIARKKKSS